MTAEQDPLMTPLALADGRGVLVRRTTAAVIRRQREMRHERGYDDEVLDNLNILPMVLFLPDGSPVSEEFIETVAESDLVQVYAIAKGVTRPNLSAPSSSGTPPKDQKARKSGRGKRRSNG